MRQPFKPYEPGETVCQYIDRLEATIRRMHDDRLRLDHRIRCQRMALRQNWEIIEMRASYKRAWYPSPLLKSMLNRNVNRKLPWWRRVMTRALHGISANRQLRNVQ